MANKKERLITRTLTSSVVNIMFFDMTQNKQTSERETLSGDFTKSSDSELLAYAREHYEKVGEKIVLMAKVIKTDKKRYAITETDFLKYAHEMTAEEEKAEKEEEGKEEGEGEE